MPPPLLYDISQMDFENPLFDIHAIREVNPQRGAMEHLTAIVHVDRELHGIVGYKDVTDQEFWVAGHMPGAPLMPGVIMCEAIAQLAGFYARKYDLIGGAYIGFGGMNEVRFRAPVYPNCRLVLMVRSLKVKRNIRAEFEFLGLVDDKVVVSGQMIGVPIDKAMRHEGT